ncbi:VWA domain-containing protein [Microbacterium sp. zg-YB36]|uniref:VWA domain-containing protein n=1 Tax=Microbacterium sp. zg-YB36 TaxID=2969407 RepID=UPI00214AC552|nr:VWA domain-containing protein [Microbacterium sp. zg-YB36]MDL5351458.1 VWA domain-containing protein [Microbacterium sp. zg-YB36]
MSAPHGGVPMDAAARGAWERALALWGVHMHDAQLLPGAGAEQGAPAWFTFPPAITVDPVLVQALGGAAELESVFAHELGHHVLAPSTRIDALKIRHQLARALVAAGAETIADGDVALLSNLWADLLVNTRVALLQRRRDADGGEPGIVRLARELYRESAGTQSRLWWLYLRAYELLWNLPAGALVPVQAPEAPGPAAPAPVDELPLERLPERLREQEVALRAARREARRVAAELAGAITTHPVLDADLLAGIVRTFAGDPVTGALRFGVLVAPYLVEERAAGAAARGRMPGGGCAADHAPATAGELGRILADRRLQGPVPDRSGRDSDEVGYGPGATGQGRGQRLDVARTLELYAASDADAVVAAWYRAQAAPWVKPMSQRVSSRPAASLPGPLELWETGDDLADLDWPATLQAGAVVIPGVTTRRRSVLDDEPEKQEGSIELDLYIDSSGSMLHPHAGSPAVLAGTILALSVLRGGGRVRVASFSGPGQVAGSERFTRDAARVAADLACYFGHVTSFPLDLLDRRYAQLAPPRSEERRHLVVLSDDGLTSMFGDGNEPFADVAARTRTKLTTATLVVLARARRVEPLARAAGYDVLYLELMADAPRVCARLAEVLHG